MLPETLSSRPDALIIPPGLGWTRARAGMLRRAIAPNCATVGNSDVDVPACLQLFLGVMGAGRAIHGHFVEDAIALHAS